MGRIINGWNIHQDSLTATIGDTMLSVWITREGDFEESVRNLEESARTRDTETHLFTIADQELLLTLCPMITVRVCERGVPVHACQMKPNYETTREMTVCDIARETSPEELLQDTWRSRLVQDNQSMGANEP